MPNTCPIFQVDAFAQQAFSGNPAAVCWLEKPANETWMQAVAAEMNLSETAFVYAVENGFNLRWFTPVAEVKLCGHATLATAHVLWEENKLATNKTAYFHTKSGVLTAKKTNDGVVMDFPITSAKPVAMPIGLLDALGITQGNAYFNDVDYLITVTDETTLHAITPDFSQLKQIDARCIIVTAESTQTKYDFITRVFAPAYGIDEDPVTGSAYCMLAPFWAERLDKEHFHAFQASTRGGDVGMQIVGERILLSGQATTVFSGCLHNCP